MLAVDVTISLQDGRQPLACWIMEELPVNLKLNVRSHQPRSRLLIHLGVYSQLAGGSLSQANLFPSGVLGVRLWSRPMGPQQKEPPDQDQEAIDPLTPASHPDSQEATQTLTPPTVAEAAAVTAGSRR